MQRRIRRGAAALPILPLALARAAHAASNAPFAAPAGYDAPGTGLGITRVILALALVLAAVYAAAALLRRLRTLGAPGSTELQVVAQVALGARERAVLLRAGTQQLLVGVAPGSVRLLCALAAQAPGAAPAEQGARAGPDPERNARPDFRALLRRSLGL